MTKPKFRLGDVVEETVTEETFIVGRRHFDPCDGWEYAPAGTLRFCFEEDLKLKRPAKRKGDGG